MQDRRKAAVKLIKLNLERMDTRMAHAAAQQRLKRISEDCPETMRFVTRACVQCEEHIAFLNEQIEKTKQEAGL